MVNDVEETQPLFSIKLELYEKRIRFSPSLNFDDNAGLFKLMENILQNIFHIADAIPRVFQPTQPMKLQVTFKGNKQRQQLFPQHVKRCEDCGTHRMRNISV